MTTHPRKYEIFTEEDFMKDCPNSKFVPTTLPPVKRIIAMGDIHGDLDLARKSFKLANLIDDNDNWIADPPDTVVVQVGDQIDSCRPIPGVFYCHQKQNDDKMEDIDVMKFFDDIQQKAEKVGGRIYSLLGNHELMNVNGDFNYVSHNNYYNFYYRADDGTEYRGKEGRKNAFQPGGPIASWLACNRMSVIVIGSIMFVHAGVLPVLARKIEYLNIDNSTKLKYLNAIIRKWLLHQLNNVDQETGKLLVNSEDSPFWTRIYGNIPTNTPLESGECFFSVKQIMEVFKIGKIVIGHTPQLFTNNDGINGTCYEKGVGNTLYRVDGGFSRAFRTFNNPSLVQVLEITDDKHFRIISDPNLYKYSHDMIPKNKSK